MAFRTLSQPVLVRPAKHARIESYVCEEDVIQGQVLKPGGTNPDEVEPSDTDGERSLGVALFDQSAGNVVDVVVQGTCRLTDNGQTTINADDRIASGGGSEEGEVQAAGSGDHVFGHARFDGGGDGNDVICYVDFVQSQHAIGGTP